jgi:hypothetical protein
VSAAGVASDALTPGPKDDSVSHQDGERIGQVHRIRWQAADPTGKPDTLRGFEY